MWIYGFHPVREALRAEPPGVELVLLGRDRVDARSSEIVELCSAAGVVCRRVEESEISDVLEEEPGSTGDSAANNGVAALTREEESRQPPPADAATSRIVVLAEDVQDPRNLGALIRVCDAAGVERLLIRDRGSAQVTPAVVKTSAGAAQWLPVERVTNSTNEIERLKNDGYWIYGAAEGGLAPWEIDLSGKVALCVGGEEKGLRRRTRESCDELVGLPMAGRVESLNLATAAAAILYEIVRQGAGGR